MESLFMVDDEHLATKNHQDITICQRRYENGMTDANDTLAA